MNETKIYQIQEYCLYLLNPLLLILSVYDQKIEPGLFLQWVGKFHPLVLHFPIVFGILIVVYFLFFQGRRLPADTEKVILSGNALITVTVALLGLLLSKEGSYDHDIVNFHKWGGVAISLFSWSFLYILDQKIRHKQILSGFFFIVLMASSHKGAQLTHGTDVLDFPETAKTADHRSEGEATVFEKGINPILQAKCVSCHGAEKMKGKLQLNTPEYIMKGGKSGNILEGDKNRPSILSERINLPVSDQKHMPPDGKLQLTRDEIIILSKWIRDGGNFKTKFNSLIKNDSLFTEISKIKPTDIRPVNSKNNLPDLTEYNTSYCTVNYLYHGSDEVEANFFQGSFYNRETLKKLTSLKSQVTSLNLQGMPLTKEDLSLIVQFENLKSLNINYTKLDLPSIEVLKQLNRLKTISICGIEFDESGIDHFLDRSKFTRINIWLKNTNKKLQEKVKLKYPDIQLVAGDNMEDQLIRISKPIVDQDSSILSDHLDIKMKHLLKGTSIRYTTDGSDPDSLKSPEYLHALRISGNTTLKVKAFKPGWIGSEIVQRTFYKSEIHPDTIFLITKPDPKYIGIGAKTLIDYELGEMNTSNGKWLACKETNMEFVVGFRQPKLLTGARLNTFVDTGSHIFPAVTLTVQGSMDGKQFQNITRVNYPAVQKPGPPRGVKSLSCDFPKSTAFNYYKFILVNVKKIPQWNPGKGKPAWVFMDELFLN